MGVCRHLAFVKQRAKNIVFTLFALENSLSLVSKNVHNALITPTAWAMGRGRELLQGSSLEL